jgi:hypothetical protein
MYCEKYHKYLVLVRTEHINVVVYLIEQTYLTSEDIVLEINLVLLLDDVLVH